MSDTKPAELAVAESPAAEPTTDASRLPAWPIAIVLFVITALVLLKDLGTRPGYAYNWEAFPLRDAFLRWEGDPGIWFRLTNGLMTTSGQTWFFSAPVALVWEIFGVGLTALRVPSALVSAAIVPLTWFAGRRLVGERAALLAAGFVMLNSAFYFYGRTGTSVGESLAPMLGIVILLDVLLRLPRRWALWLAGLQVALIVATYGYAPLRFLYPIAVALLLVQAALDRARWKQFLVMAGVTAFVLPIFVASIDDLDSRNPREVLRGFYHARGEQVLTLREDIANQRAADPEAFAGEPNPVREQIETNVRNLGDLLLDRERVTPITDYWNPGGRLYASALVPWAILGAAVALLRVFRSAPARLLHAGLWGFTLPILLTNNVHVGRLVFVIPFLALAAGLGVVTFAETAARVVRDERHRARVRIALTAALGIVVLVLAGRSWYADVSVPYTRDLPERVDVAMREAAALGRPGVIYVSGYDQEAAELEVSAARVLLVDTFQFVRVWTDDVADPSDPRQPLYFGAAVMERMATGVAPGDCDMVWIVLPPRQAEFDEAAGALTDRCGGPVEIVFIPD